MKVILIAFEIFRLNSWIPAFAGILSSGRRQNKYTEKFKHDQYNPYKYIRKRLRMFHSKKYQKIYQSDLKIEDLAEEPYSSSFREACPRVGGERESRKWMTGPPLTLGELDTPVKNTANFKPDRYNNALFKGK